MPHVVNGEALMCLETHSHRLDSKKGRLKEQQRKVVLTEFSRAARNLTPDLGRKGRKTNS